MPCQSLAPPPPPPPPCTAPLYHTGCHTVRLWLQIPATDKMLAFLSALGKNSSAVESLQSKRGEGKKKYQDEDGVYFGHNERLRFCFLFFFCLLERRCSVETKRNRNQTGSSRPRIFRGRRPQRRRRPELTVVCMHLHSRLRRRLNPSDPRGVTGYGSAL